MREQNSQTTTNTISALYCEVHSALENFDHSDSTLKITEQGRIQYFWKGGSDV